MRLDKVYGGVRRGARKAAFERLGHHGVRDGEVARQGAVGRRRAELTYLDARLARERHAGLHVHLRIT
jgi:hypothetical protein